MCQRKPLLGRGRGVLQGLLTAILTASTALAQPSIPSSIREGTSSPRGAEEVIEKYVEHWIDALASEKDTPVRQIREALTEPLRSPGSDIFKSAYSSRLSSRLRPLLASDDVVVRLNAAMAVGHLIDPGAVSLIKAALSDTRLGSSAIHLHAARSAARLAESGRLTSEAQAMLVASLRAAYEMERAQPAVEEIMRALGALSTDEAAAVLVAIINARTARHAANPRLPIRAEIEAMTRLARETTRQIFEDRLEDGEARVRLMAQVSHRYLCHCAAWLRDSDSDDPLRKDHARMAKLADEVLRLVMDVLDDQARLPDKVEPDIDKRRWEEVLLRCAEWKVVLTQHGLLPNNCRFRTVTSEMLPMPRKPAHGSPAAHRAVSRAMSQER